MRKHKRVRVVLAAAIFAAVLTATVLAKADSASPWLESGLSVRHRTDNITLSAASYGNVDCFMDQGECVIATSYGAVRGAKISLGGSYWPISNAVDGKSDFVAVPNSSELISYRAAAYGIYMYFNYNFTSSVKLVNETVNGMKQTYYQVVVPPDGKLADKSGRLLAGDPASISFSSNGQWMVVSSPNVAMLRVNLQTLEVLPFAGGFSYSIGNDPAVKTAITNDGRYAVVASRTANRFEIYDLSTCGAVPNYIYTPVSCQSRDLGNFVRQQVVDYDHVDQARFLNDDAISVYADYRSGAAAKNARFIIGDDNDQAQLDYLALGDSYISGEGAFDYVSGTDTAGNLCHLSYLSYPFLIGRDLNFDSYHSVACSGATTDDIIDASAFYSSQAGKKDGATRAVWDKNGQSSAALSSFLPGYVDQLDFVKLYQPEAITISIGGNDMGFANILAKCVKPNLQSNTCYSTYEDRQELINQIETTVYNNLLKTYGALKAAGPPGMRIYAIGYPQIAKPGGNCALNVQLSNDELIFAQRLTDYLDSVIQLASAKSGVQYVNTQDALEGHRLCEAGPGQAAVNGLTLGNDRPLNGLGPIGDESYHPNALGYKLLENKILAETDNLTALMPLPLPSPDTTASDVKSRLLLDAPHSGRQLNIAQYDSKITDDLVYKQTPVQVSINGAGHALAPAAKLQAQLHSDPIELGTFSTDNFGNMSGLITVPANAPAGVHTLHFYGADIDGQAVDIYKNIWVACTADDLDCDGAADSGQSCVGIPNSGQDYDKDGIDDACDGNISAAPAEDKAGASQIPGNTASAATTPVKITAGAEPSTSKDSSVTPLIITAADSGGQSAESPRGKVLAENTHANIKPENVSAGTGHKNDNSKFLWAGGAGAAVLGGVLLGRRKF